jgi:hypothetical protein
LVRHREPTIAWSREHPVAARLYWREAFRLLRNDKECDHWKAYEILSQCRGITDPEEMQRRMEEVKTSVAIDCPPDEQGGNGSHAMTRVSAAVFTAAPPNYNCRTMLATIASTLTFAHR